MLYTQVNRQASVARIIFAGFFGTISSSINKILLDAQIKNITQVYPQDQTYMTKNIIMQIQHQQHHRYQPYPKITLYHKFPEIFEI